MAPFIKQQRHPLQTYLFYDIETTGLNKAFDQVLQFAAIRTDLNLQEIERYEINVKLNPDIIPSPYALITHHIGLKENAESFSEFSAIKQIHQYFNHPGTISLGYNTLGFDDEFLRFSFYRNLLPPYTHQFANNCSRMDLYPMTLMYFLFKPHVLNWPTHEGKTTLKLEYLNSANQLTEGRAHNAMVDVEATLELARRLFKEREMWDYVKDYFNKKIDQERLQPLQNNTIALMVDGRLRDHAYLAPVLYVGQHRHYKNQLLWLQLDSPELTKITKNNITETTRVTNKKCGEPYFILPLKDRFTTQLHPKRRALAEHNKKWLETNPESLKLITDYYTDYQYPTYPNTDVEASLYLNGFYSAEEESFCRLFHKVPPKEKARLTEELHFPKLKTLALRILGRHFSDAMSHSQQEQFSAYLRAVNPVNDEDAIIDFQGRKRTTPTSALQDITDIKTQKLLSNEQMALLSELEQYLESFSGINSLTGANLRDTT
jgi:exodeoxyribonuclease-1